MRLVVKKLNLLHDGYIPRDSMSGDRYMALFCEAKPLIDYAFKVERSRFVRVWWFDRYLSSVVDIANLGFRPRLGAFYPVHFLRSETDLQIANYLSELGWQVRLAMYSIDRLEYIVLVVFSAQGAILEEDEEYFLLTLEAQEELPLDDFSWVEPKRKELTVGKAVSQGQSKLPSTQPNLPNLSTNNYPHPERRQFWERLRIPASLASREA